MFVLQADKCDGLDQILLDLFINHPRYFEMSYDEFISENFDFMWDQETDMYIFTSEEDYILSLLQIS